LRKVYDDKNRQEDAVRGSKLDWVLVRPVVLNDKPTRGAVRALTDLSGVHGGTRRRCQVRGSAIDRRHLAPPRTADHVVTTARRCSRASSRKSKAVCRQERGQVSVVKAGFVF
jgi:hypothetical protein